METGFEKARIKISVIVPCYNIAKYITRCLDSIASQTYEHFECIIIDDGSTDNTFNLVKTYTEQDSRFKVEGQLNSGVSAARNRGIALASGDYIYFLDGDDWIAPDDVPGLSVILQNIWEEDAPVPNDAMELAAKRMLKKRTTQFAEQYQAIVTDALNISSEDS